jgi:hypothetical protein
LIKIPNSDKVKVPRRNEEVAQSMQTHHFQSKNGDEDLAEGRQESLKT